MLHLEKSWLDPLVLGCTFESPNLLVISRIARAIVGTITSGSSSYFDPSVETPGQEVGDVLWRSVVARRGGRRGYSIKVRHLTEGLASGVYFNHHPFISQEGRTYADRWGFSILESVLQGGSVWEIESSEGEQAQSEDPPSSKARSIEATPKPAPSVRRPVIPKASVPRSAEEVFSRGPGRIALAESRGADQNPEEVESSESPERVEVVEHPIIFPKARPKPKSVVAPASSSSAEPSSRSLGSRGPAVTKALPAPRLRPRDTILPDTVLWFDRPFFSDYLESQGKVPRDIKFVEVKRYSNFDGYCT